MTARLLARRAACTLLLLAIGQRAAAQSPADEYAALFVTLAEQALRDPRLTAPMPCLPHWLAGSDHLVVAVSAGGGRAGLERGDRLQQIGAVTLTGSGPGLWDAAVRALGRGQASYRVDVTRAGRRVQLDLPCDGGGAERLYTAERAMWTSITQRAWDTCVAQGDRMVDAFGADFSPPLMIMTRCTAAKPSGADAALLNRLAQALLAELAADPQPSPDLREQLLLTLRDLDDSRAAGGTDYATPLRTRMQQLGLMP